MDEAGADSGLAENEMPEDRTMGLVSGRPSAEDILSSLPFPDKGVDPVVSLPQKPAFGIEGLNRLIW